MAPNQAYRDVRAAATPCPDAIPPANLRAAICQTALRGRGSRQPQELALPAEAGASRALLARPLLRASRGGRQLAFAEAATTPSASRAPQSRCRQVRPGGQQIRRGRFARRRQCLPPEFAWPPILKHLFGLTGAERSAMILKICCGAC